MAERASFRASDIFAVNLAEATVVMMYLLSGLVAKLEPKLLAELKPGTRIVAHDYGFPKWQPDRKVEISKTYMLYIVPAKVAGSWSLGNARLQLEQNFQELTGTLSEGAQQWPVSEAKLRGGRGCIGAGG